MSLKEKILPYEEMITTGKSDSILSGLYRTILYELGIEESRFTTLVHKYVTRMGRDVASQDISSVRGNYVIEFLKTGMTWKVFVKGLQVINITDCNIAIQVWFNDPNRPSVSVSHKVQLLPEKDKPVDFDVALTALFNSLMFAMDVTPSRFNQLLDLHVRRTHTPNNLNEVSNAKGYLKKELLGSRISWKVFVKSLSFLDASNFVFAVQLHHRTNAVTEHRRSISLDHEDIE